MYEFKLPDLGEGIHEAEVLKWHVRKGEQVAQDAPLVDLETDKAAVTIPSPVAGLVVSLGGAVGEVIHVGQVVVVIDDGAGAPLETSGAVKGAAAKAAEQMRGVESLPEGSRGSVSSKSGRRLAPAAPATRRLARELGVDLQTLEGTGPGGRITPEDVKASAVSATRPSPREAEATASDDSARAPEPEDQPMEVSLPPVVTGIPFLVVEPLPDFSALGPVEKEPLRSIRRKVARKMTQASILVAQVSHTDEVDVTDIDALRRRERQRRVGQGSATLTLLPFVMKAVIAGLRTYKMFNASLDPVREELVFKRYYNIGVAVDSPKGLVVPVIHGADRMSVLELAEALGDLAHKAREDRLTPAEMRGGTFTLSNIGNLGGFSPNPLVNYPEVAILGVGRAEPKPVVEGGEIVIRTRLPLALSFDHRIADGGEAARFMNDLKRRLSDPTALLLET